MPEARDAHGKNRRPSPNALQTAGTARYKKEETKMQTAIGAAYIVFVLLGVLIFILRT